VANQRYGSYKKGYYLPGEASFEGPGDEINKQLRYRQGSVAHSNSVDRDIALWLDFSLIWKSGIPLIYILLKLSPRRLRMIDCPSSSCPSRCWVTWTLFA
jgi:hypothetical protein